MNVYVIGDWMGAGIQWFFFRYQETNIGNSFIFLHREIRFIVSGLLYGRSAIASLLWVVGVVVIVTATVLIIYGTVKADPGTLKKAAFVNIAGAILFLLSVIVQYGILFHSPAGIAIPFGIPVILGVAFWQYRISTEPACEESGNEPVEKE